MTRDQNQHTQLERALAERCREFDSLEGPTGDTLKELMHACAPLVLAADAQAIEMGLVLLRPGADESNLRPRAWDTARARGNPDSDRWQDAIERVQTGGDVATQLLARTTMAIAAAHATAKIRWLGAPDNSMTDELIGRIGAIRPPGTMRLAHDGTPIWNTEGTDRTMAGWPCELCSERHCGAWTDGVRVPTRYGEAIELTGSESRTLAEGVSYLHMDSPLDDPGPRLREALLLAGGRADIAHAEASLRYTHAAIRLGVERGAVTQEWIDGLGGGIREGTRYGSPARAMNRDRIVEALTTHKAGKPETAIEDTITQMLRKALHAATLARCAGQEQERRRREYLLA